MKKNGTDADKPLRLETQTVRPLDLAAITVVVGGVLAPTSKYRIVCSQ